MPRPRKPLKISSDLPAERAPQKKPEWFKVRLQQGERYQRINSLVEKHQLNTVCKEANCPNIFECWNSGTATFMLMGDTCTRACKFCHVKSGNPKQWLDPLEPVKIAQSIKTLELSYVVLTSVNRDDLDDGGAGHFAQTVREIKKQDPRILVEALTPDFRGREEDIQTMLDSGVDVLAHNVETVRRLVPTFRDGRCSHDRSLDFHRKARERNPSMILKSSIMLGAGETKAEVLDCMQQLRDASVNILTLGQYLQPTKNHHPVIRYVHPNEFKEFEQEGLKMGFQFVASGPLVRSSYRAAEYFIENYLRRSS